jgi:hypothetical protein
VRMVVSLDHFPDLSKMIALGKGGHALFGGLVGSPRGAHSPPSVVFGALAEDWRRRPFHAVFGEGAENHMRGRMCSPLR